MIKRLLTLALLTMVMLACEKNPTASNEQGGQPQGVLQGVFIINEGNWGRGNASLSLFDVAKDTVYNQVFQQVNQRPLGDVAQSMAIYDTLGFVVVNNSHKIEVIGLPSARSVATIELPNKSPRNIVFYNDKGYVTGLYSNDVTIIDLTNWTIKGAIPVGPNPEEIIIENDLAFVAISGFGYDHRVAVIDLQQDSVVTYINVGDNPGFLAQDQQGRIHVLCVGRWPSWNDSTDMGTNGGLYVIDPRTRQVVDSLKVQGHPMELTIDHNNNGYFILNGNVVKYAAHSLEMVADQFISGFFYALEADPVSGKLYVLNAKDYIQPGEVQIYDSRAQLEKVLPVGVNPGAVTFYFK